MADRFALFLHESKRRRKDRFHQENIENAARNHGRAQKKFVFFCQREQRVALWIFLLLFKERIKTVRFRFNVRC